MGLRYELNDISAFQQIARAGSISNAAAIYNVPKATLSLHLRRLEDALEVELFVRKARGLELTDAGKVFLDNCGSIFDICDYAVSATKRAHSTIGGRLRIASSAEFGTLMMGAAALSFAAENPEVDFDLQLYSTDQILVGQIDYDCLIHVGEPSDSNLLRRKVGTVSYGLYASPQFLRRHGTPDAIDAVDGMNGVVYARNSAPERWRLGNGDQTFEATPYAKFNVNEYWMAKCFVVEGSALGYLPDFFVQHEVELGALVPVLPEWRSETKHIYAIYPAQRHRNPRVMRFVDSLCERFDEFIRDPGYSLIESKFTEKTKGAA